MIKRRKPLTIFPEPVFGDETSIRDDIDAGQFQFFLAVFGEFSNVFAAFMNKWFSTTEVQFLHTWGRKTANKVLIKPSVIQSGSYPSIHPVNSKPIIYAFSHPLEH